MKWFWLALAMAACQQPFGIAPGQTKLCQDGYHWVADSLQFHNICVKNAAPVVDIVLGPSSGRLVRAVALGDTVRVFVDSTGKIVMRKEAP